MYDLFAAQVEVIRSAVIHNLLIAENVKLSVPKIYKGENYLLLPYVILDFPRCFDKEDIFAIRTMFWWGNFFSITLHLAGIYKDLVKPYIYNHVPSPGEQLFIGVNENQWQHHFEADNFLSFSTFTQQERIALFEKNNFIKLAIKFDLDKWNTMPALLEEGYQKMAEILFSYPAGEKGL